MTVDMDERRAVLREYAILDTPREADFDDLVGLASVVAQTPVSVVNLIDARRQWFKAEVGLGVRETPLETSICAQVMLEPEFIEVSDLSVDPRFACNPLITAGPKFRFYAGVPLLTPGGHVLGTLCVLGPEPKRLEARQRIALQVLGRQVVAQMELRRQTALANAQAQVLREADERKDRFIATLAHELRNPLAPIRNAAALLMRPELAPAKRTWCGEIIGRQASQMALLLDDLLDISRVTHGKLELRCAPIALADVLRSAVELAQPLIDRKHHTLTLHLPQPELCLHADALRLAQVLGNLLRNAAKYTDDGGSIELGAAVQADGVHIWVQDDGVGLEPKALASVFEMFAQVEASLHRSEGGLGIGLALARGLVELHGGRLHAQSDGTGQGSRFTVWLPPSVLQVQPSAESVALAPVE